MKGEYQPLYRWKVTLLDENDTPHEDYCGFDGDVCIGRIQKQSHDQMNDKWMWNLHGPKLRITVSPHSGYEQEAREAARRVEERYHDLMRANGRKGSKQ